ncbi:hypothetical protein AB6A40_011348 [Gnathostoma spinigerum]|uniref:Uncharacterized protein n=1 Tax=Gnathostoma spinigerum TaxID=75299 RepID=A0ABD6F1L2_9BILA
MYCFLKNSLFFLSKKSREERRTNCRRWNYFLLTQCFLLIEDISKHFCMADDDQSPSTSASWPSGGIHGQLLAVVENAGSQELSSGLVEDIRAALNVIAQSSPSLNSVSSSSGKF